MDKLVLIFIDKCQIPTHTIIYSVLMKVLGLWDSTYRGGDGQMDNSNK